MADDIADREEAAEASKTKRGVVWMLLLGVGSQALAFITSLLIVRFIDRDTFGEATNAAIVVLTAQQFSSLGIGQYMVVKTKDRPDLAYHAAVIYFAVGLIALPATFLFTGLLARFTKSQHLAMYLPGLVFAALMDRVSVLPERILVREQRFRPVAATRAMGELAYGVSSVVFAAMGFAGMSVVFGNMIRSALKLIAFVKASRVSEWLQRTPFKFSTALEVLRFSVPISVSGTAIIFARRWDNLLVSNLFGPGVQAEYNMAYNLADTPGGLITDQLGDVLLPSFVKQSDEKRAPAFVRALSVLVLVCTPAVIGLSAVSPTVVQLLLKPQWAKVAPLLAILAVSFVTRPVSSMTYPFLQASRRPLSVMFLGVFELVSILGLIALIGPLGPAYACVAVGAAGLIRMLVGIWLIQWKNPLPLMEFLIGQMVPVIASLPMVGAVLGMRALIGPLDNKALLSARLAAEITAGAIAYAITLFVLVPARAKEAFAMLRNIRKR